MNDLFYTLGIESWKSTVGGLLMPPMPALLLVLLGAVLLLRRRGAVALTLLLLGCAGLWLSTLPVTADLAEQVLTPSPPPLGAADRDRLRRETLARTGPKTAIVVLGSGRIEMALEYGAASPKPYTLERLRYALWLARQTGLPVGYSGGLAHRAQGGETEAAVAQRVATEDFRQPLAWTEDRARDTVENARFTLALLRPAGIERIVLVTHDFHMQRSLRAFERAAAAAGTPVLLLAAPVGPTPNRALTLSDWMPSASAMTRLSYVVRDWLAFVAGA